MLRLILGTLGFCYILKTFFKKERKLKYVEALKNALLSYALSEVCIYDIDLNNFKYETFDGQKLPMFSGCDLVDSCFNYIVEESDDNNLKKTILYNRVILDKNIAIKKYLEKNLNTEKDVKEFFQNLLRSLD